jgi:hypothetical protein
MPTELAQHFHEELDTIYTVLAAFPPELADTPWRDGGWTRKQIVGHMLDSATNNRQRFVRAAIHGSFTGPDYAQDEWVPRTAMPISPGRLCCIGGRWSTKFLRPWWITFPKNVWMQSALSATTFPSRCVFSSRTICGISFGISRSSQLRSPPLRRFASFQTQKNPA